MSDESALLAAILAHPDEDTPRLMYADWLQENGQPERAEFIRIQCDPTADEAAEERAAELEERNRGRWLAGLPQFPGARWEFRRGFPEYLDVPGRLMLERYEAFARVAWLRSLALCDVVNRTVRDFCARPWPEQWIELELQEDPSTPAYMSGYDCTRGIAAIARCKQARQLRRLRLSLFELTIPGVRELAASDQLANLKRLHLDEHEPQLLAPLRERFGDRLVID
jgi:uncharacterized protein (TIGR02996 family)